MNWLFLIIVAFTFVSMFFGWRKGFFKTAISMVFLVLVLILSSLLNPYVAKFLRESTPVYESVRTRSEKVMRNYIEKDTDEVEVIGDDETEASVTEDENVPEDTQNNILESLPLPAAFKNNIIKNNTENVYDLLGADKFIDYLARYVAYSITNGIAFLLSFTIAIVLIKVALYAINILTSLPGISLINSVGGLLLGGAQAILWIWVFFVVVTVLCNTAFGRTMMSAIEGNVLLSYLYDKNVFLPVIMGIFGGS